MNEEEEEFEVDFLCMRLSMSANTLDPDRAKK